MSKKNTSSLLFEQLQSYVSLAGTLNLSQTVRDLKSTRQTVRRHIAQLEEMRGEPLFSIKDRRYRLTQNGREALQEAEEIIAHGTAWVNNAAGHINGLFHLTAEHIDGFTYYLQQFPLSKAWQSKAKLLPFGIQCWAAAGGQIETDAFGLLRPYLMIFRQFGDDWVCVEVGNESSFTTWFGKDRSQSSVGRDIQDLPGGPGFASLLSQPFQEIRMTKGLRLDHIHARIKGPNSEDLIPISYERLLMGCYFPDGSSAIAALINRTHDIHINGLSDGIAHSMPKEWVMNITPPRVVW